MSNYLFKNICTLPFDEEFHSKSYIILTGVDQVPPHFWVCVYGKCFSIDIKGFNADKDILILINSFRRFNTKCIFLEIRNTHFNHQLLFNTLHTIVASYNSVVYGQISCLEPVKDFFSNFYSIDTKNVEVLFDLLPKLEVNKIIHKIYHLNLEDHINYNNQFLIKKYSLFDIHERILSLSQEHKILM